MSTRKNRQVAQGAEASKLIQALGKNDAEGIAQLRNTVDRIKQINLSKAAMSPDKRAGFIFEEVVAGNFQCRCPQSR